MYFSNEQQLVASGFRIAADACLAADGSLEREATVKIGKDFWALTVVPPAE